MELFAIGGLHCENDSSSPASNIESINKNSLFNANETWAECYNDPSKKFCCINSMCVSLNNSILIFGGQKASLRFNLRNGYLFNPSSEKEKIVKTYPYGNQEVKIQLEQSVKFFSPPVTLKKDESVFEDQSAHGLRERYDIFDSIKLLEFKGVNIDTNEKLFFMGETNQGYPIIYTLTTHDSKINIPQKYSIYIENEDIRKNYK